MKFAAVAMVKNECDIIELFIKINSRFFDHIYFLDHMSNDNTVKIINLMIAKGYNISYRIIADKAYNQSLETTFEVRRIAKLNLYDFIMPLDADEFISIEDSYELKKLILDTVSIDGIAYIPWSTYVPESSEYFNSTAPLYSIFKKRRIEYNQFYKIIISNNFALNSIIEMGNHHATNSNINITNIPILPLQLMHAPIRSAEQIIRKVILGSHSFSLKIDRKEGEGFHWEIMAQYIRGNNYLLDYTHLFNFGINYAVQDSEIKINELDFNCIRIGLMEDDFEFRELARINILESFDKEINELILYFKNKTL